VVKQVIPFIEEKLNISSSFKRIIIGDSLAGLAATYTLAKYSTFFNLALIQSPAYWYNQGKLLSRLSSTNLSNQQDIHQLWNIRGEQVYQCNKEYSWCAEREGSGC